MEPISQAGLARLVGVSRQAVNKAIKAGRLSVDDNGRIPDRATAVREWYATARDALESPAGDGLDAAPEPAPRRTNGTPPAATARTAVALDDEELAARKTYRTNRATREEIRADRERMELDKARGQLVDRDAVKAAWAAQLVPWSEALKTLGDRLGAELEGMTTHERTIRLNEEGARILSALPRRAPGS